MSDSEEEYEDEDEERVEEGQAQVTWLRSGEMEDEDVTSLRALDRDFVLGDLVALASDRLGQVSATVICQLSLFVVHGDVVRQLCRHALLPLFQIDTCGQHYWQLPCHAAETRKPKYNQS